MTDYYRIAIADIGTADLIGSPWVPVTSVIYNGAPDKEAFCVGSQNDAVWPEGLTLFSTDETGLRAAIAADSTFYWQDLGTISGDNEDAINAAKAAIFGARPAP